MKIWRLVLPLALLLLLMVSVPMPTEGKEKNELTFIVKSSPYALFESRLHIENKELARDILKGKQVSTKHAPELPFAYVEIKKGTKTETFMISYAYNLFQVETGVKIVLPPETKMKIHSYLSMLRKHHFGESVSWKEAEKLFPRKGYAEVVDIESGLRFMVQRRAGSQHADVQPITVADTETMKDIYNGKWSWKRRAILVRTEGRTLAGSMHGMPHGGGAISWNNFPGHFCIHFKDSTTHRRAIPDPGHDLMITKASGLLHDRIVQGSPEELVSLFITAVNEQDESIIKLLLNQYEADRVEKLLQQLDQIEGVKIHSLESGSSPKDNFLMQEIMATIRVKRKEQKEQQLGVIFLLSRESVIDRWKLELNPLISQL
ncbi:hypothetical protein [Ammoniphilus sp. CFH 90114]|uniref:hypothetical protein n=1 Tax=Ammoniphilus sp. CFH 90114 TaxID=2493665 RepID=UPI00100F54AD|nr:hypothetical protein [Ammoniphilus sp. CFH 90114]RXT08155.1 hypothetical protein EIZ39_12200 [Ammoniphilus sp. CFH 90114]